MAASEQGVSERHVLLRDLIRVRQSWLEQIQERCYEQRTLTRKDADKYIYFVRLGPLGRRDPFYVQIKNAVARFEKRIAALGKLQRMQRKSFWLPPLFFSPEAIHVTVYRSRSVSKVGKTGARNLLKRWGETMALNDQTYYLARPPQKDYWVRAIALDNDRDVQDIRMNMAQWCVCFIKHEEPTPVLNARRVNPTGGAYTEKRLADRNLELVARHEGAVLYRTSEPALSMAGEDDDF